MFCISLPLVPRKGHSHLGFCIHRLPVAYNDLAVWPLPIKTLPTSVVQLPNICPINVYAKIVWPVVCQCINTIVNTMSHIHTVYVPHTYYVCTAYTECICYTIIPYHALPYCTIPIMSTNFCNPQHDIGQKWGLSIPALDLWWVKTNHHDAPATHLATHPPTPTIMHICHAYAPPYTHAGHQAY